MVKRSDNYKIAMLVAWSIIFLLLLVGSLRADPVIDPRAENFSAQGCGMKIVSQVTFINQDTLKVNGILDKITNIVITDGRGKVLRSCPNTTICAVQWPRSWMSLNENTVKVSATRAGCTSGIISYVDLH